MAKLKEGNVLNIDAIVRAVLVEHATHIEYDPETKEGKVVELKEHMVKAYISK